MTNQTHATRRASRVIQGQPATDGAGVSLMRVIGQPDLPMLDPFLLLDEFSSDNPDDYIAGFPPHPHRGFETVTYLLAGRMRHEDSAGHAGVIERGGVQWMTAGRGIVHSEMPEQSNGLLRGFQLWVNLPAAHKMDAPAYQEFATDQIPVEQREDGTRIAVISGTSSRGTTGPASQPLTDPHYFDINLAANAQFEERLPVDHNAFLYVHHGEIHLADQSARPLTLQQGDLGILSAGDALVLAAGESGAGVLLVSGRPLHEPVARAGPFVMNTRDELQQAIRDYADGRLQT